MMNVSEVCATILGQLRSKLGFGVIFGVSSREEPKIMGSLFCAAWWASHVHAVPRSAELNP